MRRLHGLGSDGPALAVRQIEAVAGIVGQQHVPAMLAPVRTVVDTHMSVEMPNATTCRAPSRLSLRSRSVPMKALLTLLLTSGSPGKGSKPGRN